MTTNKVQLDHINIALNELYPLTGKDDFWNNNAQELLKATLNANGITKQHTVAQIKEEVAKILKLMATVMAWNGYLTKYTSAVTTQQGIVSTALSPHYNKGA